MTLLHSVKVRTETQFKAESASSRIFFDFFRARASNAPCTTTRLPALVTNQNLLVLRLIIQQFRGLRNTKVK